MQSFVFDSIVMGVLCFPVYLIINRGPWKGRNRAVIATAIIVTTAYLTLRLTVMPAA